MIIAFFGHSDFVRTLETEEKMMLTLRELTDGKDAELLLGGYGAFDRFSLGCCKRLRRYNPNVKLVLVTPYPDRMPDDRAEYDEAVYPPLEQTPPRFAISARNRWMVDRAEIIIAYVNRTTGGAAKAIEYAGRKNKRVINISE